MGFTMNQWILGLFLWFFRQTHFWDMCWLCSDGVSSQFLWFMVLIETTIERICWSMFLKSAKNLRWCKISGSWDRRSSFLMFLNILNKIIFKRSKPTFSTTLCLGNHLDVSASGKSFALPGDHCGLVTRPVIFQEHCGFRNDGNTWKSCGSSSFSY